MTPHILWQIDAIRPTDCELSCLCNNLKVPPPQKKKETVAHITSSNYSLWYGVAAAEVFYTLKVLMYKLVIINDILTVKS